MPICYRLVTLLAALACVAGAVAQAPEAIVAPSGASFVTDLATRELQRYLYLASGTLLRVVGDSSRPCIVVGGPEENPLTRRLVAAGAVEFQPAELGDEGYVLRTLTQDGRTLTLVAGATPVGTLYAVYDLLERYGFGFYLGGDALPEPRDLRFLPLDQVRRPVLRIRGSLPWYNFLNSPTTWDLADYRRFFDQMAKMRMNFVGFHAYDYEPFTAVKIEGAYRFGRPLQNTSEGVWGTVPMKTEDFGFGTGECFEREYFGSSASFDYATPEEGIEKAQTLLAEALSYARQRGIHVCVGFEVHGDPSDPGNERDLELRLRHLLTRYPMIEYVWLWQSEGRGTGAQQAIPPRNTPFGNYYRRVCAQFAYLGDLSRVAEAARVSYYAHLGHEVIQHLAPQVRLIVSGWGGDRWMRFSDFYVGLDRTLPEDIIFAALDNIDPTAAPQVSHAYGEVSPARERWPIPWFESDGGGTRRDQWGPQCNVKPFTALCRDALAKGAQGLLGIHWRTRAVEEVAAYVAQFAWNPDLTYEEFYDGFALRCFGERHAGEMSTILQDLEALGPRWTGALGQVECGGFQWFSSNDRPDPAKLGKLAEIEQRLVAIGEGVHPRHRDRIEYLVHMIRWLTTYDAAALELQPGGPVEEAIARAERAKAAGKDDATAQAQAALAALRSAGLDRAFTERARLLTNQGEKGVLATANGKAYAAYRELERRITALLPEPPSAQATPLAGLDLAVTVTPDRLAPGEPLVVQAIARTDRPPVSVALHWRPLGGDRFAEEPMRVVARSVFEAVVPAERLREPGIEYFVRASDAAGRTARVPFAGAEGPFATLSLPDPGPRWTPHEPSVSARDLVACVGLDARDAGAYQVALRWRGRRGAAPHHWEVAREGGEDRVVLAEARLPGLLDFGVMPRTRYSYSVTPVAWNGARGEARAVEITTPAYPPPSKPTGVQAQPMVGRALLRWLSGEPGVDTYRVSRRSPEGAETVVATVPSSQGETTTFVDDEATPGVELAYRVIAVARDGTESEASDPVTIRAWGEAQPVLTLPLQGSLDSEQGFEARAAGDPQFVTVGQAQALQLGPSRWLAFDDRPEFSIPSEITLAAWARFDDLAGIPVLISHAQWMQSGYFLQVIGQRVRFHVALEGGVLVADAGRIEPGRWYHIVGVLDGGEARVYINGELAGRHRLPTGAQPIQVPFRGPLYVGRYRDPGPQYEVHGLVGGVSVYNGALSEEAIRAAYEAQAGRYGP